MEEEDPNLFIVVNKTPGPRTHLFTFNIGASELIDFDSDTGRSDRRSVQVPGLFEDSAWCVLPYNALFICGGGFHENKKALRMAGELNLSTMEYQSFPKMMSHRSYHSVIALSGDVYVLGGNDKYGVSQQKIEACDLSARKWNEIDPPLPKPLFKPSVTTYDDKVLFFTDFEARCVFTYNMDNGQYSRLG